MLSRHNQTPILHRAVIYGDTIYLAGMVADDKTLAVGGQTTQILEKLDVLLKTMGSDAQHLLQTTIFITDMSTKDEMNAAWTSYFQTKDLPARATVGAAQLGPQTLVEVVATAAIKQTNSSTYPSASLNEVPVNRQGNMQ
jgi:enamine deaminase RidA (YjgF/YER057c/UK114 family)